MSKRFNVTLPDLLYKQLEAWANYEGRPVASLAAYLLEKAIKEEMPVQVQEQIKLLQQEE